MPARHTSLQDGLLLEADFERRLWSTKEGVGETSGQTAGSSFGKFASRKTVRQKKQVFFVRCGFHGPQFHRASRPTVKSAPDVFADALVPGTPSFPECHRCLVGAFAGLRPTPRPPDAVPGLRPAYPQQAMGRNF